MTGDTPPALRAVPPALARRYGSPAPGEAPRKLPQPMHEPPAVSAWKGEDRRVQYPNMRNMIEAAKKGGRLRQMSALKWSAMELNAHEPRALAILDEAIEARETTHDAPPELGRRPNLIALFESLTPTERVALRWFAMKLPQKKLDTLEGALARSGDSLPAGPKRRQEPVTIEVVHPEGLPYPVRRPR